MSNIILNGQRFNFSNEDLPVLIHGKEHLGASLFTISLLANLYSEGAKILFLSGYSMARDEFIKRINDKASSVLADSNYRELLAKRTIFVKREDYSLFIELTKTLEDIDKRIILIKNIDLFPEEVFDAVSGFERLIVSGDVDKCTYRKKILSKSFKTKIFFSKPGFETGLQIPSLNKYEGYLSGVKKSGVVTLEI